MMDVVVIYVEVVEVGVKVGVREVVIRKAKEKEKENKRGRVVSMWAIDC